TPLTINVGCPHEQGEVESFLAPFRIAWPDAQVEGHYVAKYCQDRGIDDTEEPLSPALSPSEGAREKAPQLWV
ncbi:MAG: hypothetical protein WCQ21_30945, partial [Verrucomicrobiota bacterium]